MSLPAPVVEVENAVWRDGMLSAGTRAIPEETAIAMTYGGATQAVMMATPADIVDFAVGFTLAEGIVAAASEIIAIEPARSELGIDVRITLSDTGADRFWSRRRSMAGPVGCGLCGIDSLKEARRPAPPVAAGGSITAEQILAAMRVLSSLQPLNLRTHALHAAAFWHQARGVVAVREDVGRHNALDKLCGAMARQGIAMHHGAVLLTSRVSIEMVQKTAIAGCPILVAISAPTALAVATAEQAGITLVAITRDDGFEVFTHPHRIIHEAAAQHVA